MMTEKIIGTKRLRSWEVSMRITAREYVILVYPAMNPEHPSTMFFFLKVSQSS
jgi:hypothetical protein